MGLFFAVLILTLRSTFAFRRQENHVKSSMSHASSSPTDLFKTECADTHFNDNSATGLCNTDFDDNLMASGLGFAARPSGESKKMTALADLVGIIVAGLIENSRSQVSAVWDKQKQTLRVELPEAMHGQIASSSRVPFKLHVTKMIEFGFSEKMIEFCPIQASCYQVQSAEVSIDGLWLGPLQGVHRFLTNQKFKDQLKVLVDKGLGSSNRSNAHVDTFDTELDDLAKIARDIYTVELKDNAWKEKKLLPDEAPIAEWIANTYTMLTSIWVRPFVDPQDFPTVVSALAQTVPVEITKFIVVEHSSGLQVRGKKRAIHLPISELTNPSSGEPILSDQEYDALSRAADRQGYKTMAIQKSVPTKGTKTVREVALGMGQAQSALSWLAMWACDPDFPGFAEFPMDLGKNKMRYPEDEPVGGKLELVRRMLKLCNDADCKGDAKGRTKWLPEPPGFAFADAVPGQEEHWPTAD